MYFPHTKDNSIHNTDHVIMFQELLANKHHRLGYSKFGHMEVGFGRREKNWDWLTDFETAASNGNMQNSN